MILQVHDIYQWRGKGERGKERGERQKRGREDIVLISYIFYLGAPYPNCADTVCYAESVAGLLNTAAAPDSNITMRSINTKQKSENRKSKTESEKRKAKREKGKGKSEKEKGNKKKVTRQDTSFYNFAGGHGGNITTIQNNYDVTGGSVYGVYSGSTDSIKIINSVVSFRREERRIEG
jgi:hypothetical protein